MTRRRGGFSLVEVLVTMALLVIFLAVTFLNLRGPAGGAGSIGMAETVAAQLTVARRRAVSQHTTVALVIPSGGGTRAHAQSFYFLEGDLAPKVTQVYNLASELPDTYLAVGAFPCTAPLSIQSPASSSIKFDIANWLKLAVGYQPKDYVVAFAPDGSVITNDLVWHGSQLQIVTCSGFPPPGAVASLGGTPVAGSNSANNLSLKGLRQANTVCISPTGQVWVVAGLAQDSGGGTSSDPANPGPPAAPPVQPGQVNSAPKILSTVTLPESKITSATNTNLSKANSIINPSDSVTVTVRATDADADDHLCLNLTASGGAFSVGTRPIRLTWDPTDTNTTAYPKGCWKATFSWTPPGSPDDPQYKSPSGTDFEIRGQVTDDHGASALLGGSAQVLRMHVVNQGHLIFTSRQFGSTWLYKATPGSKICTPFPNDWVNSYKEKSAQYHFPVVSPDGSMVAYTKFNSSFGGPTAGGVFTCNIQGDKVKQVLNYYPSGPVTWSPDGSRLCFMDSAYGPTNQPTGLVFINANGSGSKSCIRDGPTPSLGISSPGLLAWSPVIADNLLAYVDSNGLVVVCKASDAQPMPSGTYVPVTPAPPPSKINVTPPGGTHYYRNLQWSKDGKNLMFTDTVTYVAPPVTGSSTISPPGICKTYTCKVTPGSPISVTNPSLMGGSGNIKGTLVFDPSGSLAGSVDGSSNGYASTPGYGWGPNTGFTAYILNAGSLSPLFQFNLPEPADTWGDPYTGGFGMDIEGSCWTN